MLSKQINLPKNILDKLNEENFDKEVKKFIDLFPINMEKINKKYYKPRNFERRKIMRCNQVSILIERFGEYVPKDYPNDIQRISVYCDDFTSIYAALAKANAMAINTLNEYENIGVRSYVSTNEYSAADYREMHGYSPREYNTYEDDLELQFTYKSEELLKDRIFVHENLDEIIKLIAATENKKELRSLLKEKFGLRDFQIKKLLSMRLDMLSKADYLADVKERNEYDANKDNPGWSPIKMIPYYEEKIRANKAKIAEYQTYITIAENYKDMIDIIRQKPEFEDFSVILKEKYGFDRAQTGLVRLVTVDDLISTQKFKAEIEKLEEFIERDKAEMFKLMDMQKNDSNESED